MNERDIKLMRFRSNFHRLYSTTVLLDVIVIPVLIYFSYLSRQAKNDNLLFAFITLIALIAIISILVSKYAKKHGFEKSPIPPYTIQLSPCNLEEFKNTISFFPRTNYLRTHIVHI